MRATCGSCSSSQFDQSDDVSEEKPSLLSARNAAGAAAARQHELGARGGEAVRAAADLLFTSLCSPCDDERAIPKIDELQGAVDGWWLAQQAGNACNVAEMSLERP